MLLPDASACWARERALMTDMSLVDVFGYAAI
jgi:hypothetical protein